MVYGFVGVIIIFIILALAIIVGRNILVKTEIKHNPDILDNYEWPLKFIGIW